MKGSLILALALFWTWDSASAAASDCREARRLLRQWQFNHTMTSEIISFGWRHNIRNATEGRAWYRANCRGRR